MTAMFRAASGNWGSFPTSPEQPIPTIGDTASLCFSYVGELLARPGAARFIRGIAPRIQSQGMGPLTNIKESRGDKCKGVDDDDSDGKSTRLPRTHGTAKTK